MPAFSITPLRGNTPPAPDDAPLGVQFQRAGENVGDRSFDTINVTGGLIATRGAGADSNVITLAPTPPPPPITLPGWMTSINDPDSTPLHANNGSGELFLADVGPLIGSTIYAGIEGYTGQVVTWDWDWAFVPFQGESTSHPPVVVELSGGRVSVTYAYDDEPYDENGSTSGILTLTATVDAVVLAQTIEVATGTGLYTPIAWQPTP